VKKYDGFTFYVRANLEGAKGVSEVRKPKLADSDSGPIIAVKTFTVSKSNMVTSNSKMKTHSRIREYQMAGMASHKRENCGQLDRMM
jgi:hypothetical protein